MVKHIILWKIDEKFSKEEKQKIMTEAKRELEALKGKVPGLLEIKLQTEKLPSSNADMMLDSTLENEDALKAYQVHPDHVTVANDFVRPFTSERLCLDFKI
ncbi:MAG: Dabb family protein [Clostridia bacterium]|nr:Dabb family protein [Clostridia bacterium]